MAGPQIGSIHPARPPYPAYATEDTPDVSVLAAVQRLESDLDQFDANLGALYNRLRPLIRHADDTADSSRPQEAFQYNSDLGIHLAALIARIAEMDAIASRVRVSLEI